MNKGTTAAFDVLLDIYLRETIREIMEPAIPDYIKAAVRVNARENLQSLLWTIERHGSAEASEGAIQEYVRNWMDEQIAILRIEMEKRERLL